jgi:hypothetical protein
MIRGGSRLNLPDFTKIIIAGPAGDAGCEFPRANGLEQILSPYELIVSLRSPNYWREAQFRPPNRRSAEHRPRIRQITRIQNKVLFDIFIHYSRTKSKSIIPTLGT